MAKFLSFFLAVSCLLFASCGKYVPPGIMTDEEMTDFLTDAYLIEGFYAIETGYHYETLTDEIVASYNQLLSEHGISKEKYERSRDFYMRHPSRYEEIHSNVVSNLDGHVDENSNDVSTKIDLLK